MLCITHINFLTKTVGLMGEVTKRLQAVNRHAGSSGIRLKCECHKAHKAPNLFEMSFVRVVTLENFPCGQLRRAGAQ
jgi:hypothetical protein